MITLSQPLGVARPSPSASAAGREPFLNTELRTYSFAELAAATDNFSATRAIGSGGFGTVFRATLPDDSEVRVLDYCTVKCLKT